MSVIKRAVTLATVPVLAAAGAVLLALPVPVTAQASTHSLSSTGYRAAATLPSTGPYGAIAYSPETGTYEPGFGGDEGTAAANAVKQCQSDGGGTGCWAMLWFNDAVGAIAKSGNGVAGMGLPPSDDGHVGTGWAAYDNLQRAENVAGQEAVKSCETVSDGVTCTVAKYWPTSSVSSSGTAGWLPEPTLDAIPYISQYQGQARQYCDCGPTSAAMVIQAYGMRPPGLSDKAFVTDVRDATGNLSACTKPHFPADTNSAQLARALIAYGLASNMIKGSDPLAAMKQAVSGSPGIPGRPVIALVSGEALDRGTAYGDHWVVVKAFSSNRKIVYLDDPDANYGGQISLPYSTFSSAVLKDHAILEDQGVYGIIVVPSAE